jgi:BRCT domain type II-containing protein
MGPAKLQKAEKLGVKILSESEFIELIGGAVVVEQAPTTQAPTASEQVIQTTLF